MNKIKFYNDLQVSDFHSLDVETRSLILCKITEADKAMRDKGQVVPVWDGPCAESEMINHEVAAKTEKGEVVGKAIYFGKLEDSSGIFKRSVYVHVPSSGSVWEVDSKNVRLATKDDFVRMKSEIAMANTLLNVAEEVTELIKTKRTKKVVGSHLVEDMMQTVKTMGLAVDEKSGFYKIFGNKKGVCVYLAKKGGKAVLSNFCIEHHAIDPISEEQAKAKHLGKVRGEINFTKPIPDVLAAWDVSLKFLG